MVFYIVWCILILIVSCFELALWHGKAGYKCVKQVNLYEVGGAFAPRGTSTLLLLWNMCIGDESGSTCCQYDFILTCQHWALQDQTDISPVCMLVYFLVNLSLTDTNSVYDFYYFFPFFNLSLLPRSSGQHAWFSCNTPLTFPAPQQAG